MATTRKSKTGLKGKLVTLLVRIRTSFIYVWFAIGLPILWILLHRFNILHIDNFDMTYLNVSLSILAEVQGVVLLIYTSRIVENQSKSDEKREQLINKLGQIHKMVDELEIDLEDVERDIKE